MTVRFHWSDGFTVGVDELDGHHKHIFELGNKIQDADPSMARKFVMELYKYIRIHFSREEQHMKDIGFPLLDEHREKHEKLITDFNALTEGFTWDDFEEFTVFLHAWLVKHVLLDDKKYFAYARFEVNRDVPT